MQWWLIGLGVAVLLVIAVPLFNRPNQQPAVLELTYRRTVVYESEGVSYEASGLAKARTYYSAGGIDAGAGLRILHHGDALYVDIPNVGRVFTVFEYSEPSPGTMISKACGLPAEKVDNHAAAARWLQALDEKFSSTCQVAPSLRPVTIILSDPQTPHSAKAYSRGYLPPGLTITKFEIERTTDPITTGIEAATPWIEKRLLADINILAAHGPAGSITVSKATLIRRDFKTDIESPAK